MNENNYLDLFENVFNGSFDFQFDKDYSENFTDDIAFDFLKKSFEPENSINSIREQKNTLTETNIIEEYENNQTNPIKLDENSINNKRMDFLRNSITNEFINCIKDEPFEFGFISKSEIIIKEQLEINAMATKNWLNELYLNNFSNETILIGILRLLGRFNETLIEPQGITMAMAAIIHKNNEIKELGVRAFENWGSRNCLRFLKTIHIEEKWLQEYIDDIIIDLEEEYTIADSENK